MVDFARGFGGSDNSVGAVLASEADSTEFRVDAMLCLDAERRTPCVLEWLFGVNDLELCELEPAHSRPRNRDAAACICGKDMPVEAPCDSL